MKKFFLLFIAMILFARIAKSQMGPLSLSADLALPMGEFAEMVGPGLGLNWGYESFLSDKVGLTLHLGSTAMIPRTGDTTSSSPELLTFTMLQAQLGLKYYFLSHDNGWYGQFQVGASRSMSEYEYAIGYYYSNPNIYETVSRFTSFSVGYKAGRKWDYSFRINSMKELDSSSADPARYLNFRIARTLFGDRRD